MFGVFIAFEHCVLVIAKTATVNSILKNCMTANFLRSTTIHNMESIVFLDFSFLSLEFEI